MPERYLSPVLQTFPGIARHTASLLGVEALIYNRLWRLIVEGKLRAGAKLREDIIGDVFDISRTIVRKVLVIMEQEGIVELPSNRGAFVATPTPKEAQDAVQAARMISVHVAKKLAESGYRLTSANLERLKRHIELQAEAEKTDEFAVVRIISGEFLVLLAHVHGNKILADQFEILVSRLTLAASIYQRGERKLRISAAFESMVLEHILAHEQEQVGKAMGDLYDSIAGSFYYGSKDSEVDFRSILMGDKSAETSLFAVPLVQQRRKPAKERAD